MDVLVWDLHRSTWKADLRFKAEGKRPWERALDALVTLGSPGFDALVGAIRSSDERIRDVAAGRLRSAKDPRTVGPLAAALGHDDEGVRRAAAIAMSEMNDLAAAQALAGALDDPDPSVRQVAAFSLAQRGDPRVVDELIRIGRTDPSMLAERMTVWVSLAEHPSAFIGVEDPAPLPALAGVLRPVLAALPSVVEALSSPRLNTLRIEGREGRHALEVMSSDVPVPIEETLARLLDIQAAMRNIEATHASMAVAVGPGAEHARQQIAVICKNLDDAVAALRDGRDPDGQPITVWQVGRGLQSLVDDASGAAWAGLMSTVVDHNGVLELQAQIRTLGEVGTRLSDVRMP